MSKFDDYLNIELNKTIEKTLIKINNHLKDYEKIIKCYFNNQINNDLQNRIKCNMKQLLLINLNDFTKKFKLNQKLYSEKYKDLVGEEDPTFALSNSNENVNEKKGDFLKIEESNKLQQRDNELSLLLNNVNELTTIFKDIQTIVMEQGSILDRIDYNLEIAGHNVLKSKNSIRNANEYHKKNCFRNIIIILLIIIFVELFMILFKFL